MGVSQETRVGFVTCLALCSWIWIIKSNYNRANEHDITVDVTVTKMAGYVRVHIFMNRWFFRIFGIHSFYATATFLNIWICMQWTDAADGGCWGGQCDLNIPSLSPRESRSKAVANDFEP